MPVASVPSSSSPPSPPRLAWVGGTPPVFDAWPATPTVFEDSDDLLLSPLAFEYDLYVVQLQQPGVSGLDLLRLIRKRSQAPLVALGSTDDLVRALDTGADMLLPPSSDGAQVAAALRAVQRRVQAGQAVEPAWVLDDARALLSAPGGQDIALSDSELLVMRCFAESDGQPVPRSQMMQRLWGQVDSSMDNALHATVYRLRRRIEQAGCPMAPIQSVSRVGYSFRAPLSWHRSSVVPPVAPPAASAAVLKRHDVHVEGDGEPALMLVHGFGCDQTVWRRVTPALHERHRLLLMDLAGYGGSPPSSYDFDRHDTLRGHAQDLLEVAQASGLERPVLVGHSVGAMAAVVASVMRPSAFRALVLVAPSPSFVDHGDYRGGLSREAIDEVLQSLDSDYLAWADHMAPAVMGAGTSQELKQELVESFRRAHPALAPHFARVAFLSDIRDELSKVRVPTLLLQSSDDPLAPVTVGEYMAQRIPGSELRVLKAEGHLPHMTAPAEVAAAIEAFVSRLAR